MGAEDQGVGVIFDNGVMKVTRTRGVGGGAKSAFTVGELPSSVIKGTSPEQQKYRRVRFSIELAWSLKKKKA